MLGAIKSPLPLEFGHGHAWKHFPRRESKLAFGPSFLHDSMICICYSFHFTQENGMEEKAYLPVVLKPISSLLVSTSTTASASN